MQAVLWYTDTLKQKTTLEEHSSLITDVRFSPSMARLATSSFDKTVRVWDADNVSQQSLVFDVFFLLISIFMLWIEIFHPSCFVECGKYLFWNMSLVLIG